MLEPQSSTGFKLGNTSASWTIEFWIYFDTFTGSFTPMDHRATTYTQGGFSFWTNSASGGLGFDSQLGQLILKTLTQLQQILGITML